VKDVLVVELKCVERLANEHTAECLNYLRASGRTLCLLVNFRKPKVEWGADIAGSWARPAAGEASVSARRPLAFRDGF
jgi:hypothetical protein